MNTDELKYYHSIILDLSECYKKLKKIRCEKDILEVAVDDFRGRHELLSEFSELLRRYAIFLFETSENNFSKIVKLYNEAIDSSFGNIKYRAELALLIYNHNKINSDFLEQTERCFELEKRHAIISLADTYYLGLIYFLHGKTEIAKKNYSLSIDDAKIKNWPYYDKLISIEIDSSYVKGRIWSKISRAFS